MLIPFEIHLTCTDLSQEKLPLFEKLCADHNGKALIIELNRGNFARQPMASIILTAKDAATAIHTAHAYAADFIQQGFPVSRIKIEIPADKAALVHIPATESFTPYYEWHGKVAYQQPEELVDVCKQYRAHLSANALNSDKQKRFVTLREFSSHDMFHQRIQQLTAALQPQWPVLKQQAEYCIYDNHLALDKGWIDN